MRIKKYHVKGHAYAQLIDDNNFVHYIGPWNADTLCICYYHIGFSELFNRDKKIRKYLNHHGIESEEDIKAVLAYYYIGLSGKVFSSGLEEKIKKIGERIELLDYFVEDLSDRPLAQARNIAWRKFQSLSKEQRKMMLERIQDEELSLWYPDPEK
jgi:hypothetical protein